MSYAIVYLERGQQGLETLAWIRFFEVLVESKLSVGADLMFKGILSFTLFSLGLSLFIRKIQTTGLLEDLLGSLPSAQAL